MDKEIKVIIDKANELSNLMKNHKITIDFMKSAEEIKQDRRTQTLLEKLVFEGEKLNEKINSGDDVILDNTYEIELLKAELEENEMAKNHIIIQKEYLNMINTVLERIKTPIE